MSAGRAALILTRVASAADAATLGRVLVDSHRAACVFVIETLRSTYRWEGHTEAWLLASLE